MAKQDTLKNLLDDLKHANKLSSELITAQEPTPAWPTKSELQQVSEAMTKPYWKLHADHLVSGTLQDEVIAFKLQVEFDVDITSLITASEHASQLDPKTIRSLSSRNDELDDLILAAFTPRSYGTTTDMKLSKHNQIQRESRLKKMLKNNIGILHLSLDNSILHFEYADIIRNLIGPKSAVSRKLFSQKCMHLIDDFKHRDHFTDAFKWTDHTLTHTLTATFRAPK